MTKTDILIIEDLASFEKLILKDQKVYDINMMVMPGTLQDKLKNIDPEKGIQPLRRQFNSIFLLLDGMHDLQVGATYTWLKPNDLVIVPENVVSASTHFRNCIGYCVHFKTEFIQPLLNGPLEAVFPYFYLEAQHVINVTAEESEVIQCAFRDIIAEYDRSSPERDFLLRNYIHILLLRVREIYRLQAQRMSEGMTHSMKLANRFKHLLEKNFVEMREVKQYADTLHITTKHLSDVVKSTFGKSPRQMINDMLLLEAKVLLGSTDLTASEIAYKLRFHDHAHFSHFIRQHSGCTPLELRKKL